MKNIAKTQEVQIIVDTMGSAALGALVTKTAVAVETTHSTGLLQSFLMKKIKVHSAVVTALTSGQGENLLLVLARGDATATEVKAALEGSQLERDRVTQASKRKIIHDAIFAIEIDEIIDTRARVRMKDAVSIGGGGGIPFEDGDGWSWFVYNGDATTLTTGAVINGTISYWGIWL